MSEAVNPKRNKLSEEDLRSEFKRAQDEGHTHMLIYTLVTQSAPYSIIMGYGHLGISTITPKIAVTEKAVGLNANDPKDMLNTLSVILETLCQADTGNTKPCYKPPEKTFYGVYDLSKPFDSARINYDELPNQTVETIGDLMYKERQQRKGPIQKLLEKVFN